MLATTHNLQFFPFYALWNLFFLHQNIQRLNTSDSEIKFPKKLLAPFQKLHYWTCVNWEEGPSKYITESLTKLTRYPAAIKKYLRTVILAYFCFQSIKYNACTSLCICLQTTRAPLTANTKTQLCYVDMDSQGKHIKINSVGHVIANEAGYLPLSSSALSELNLEEFRLFLARSQTFPFSFLSFFRLTCK